MLVTILPDPDKYSVGSDYFPREVDASGTQRPGDINRHNVHAYNCGRKAAPEGLPVAADQSNSFPMCEGTKHFFHIDRFTTGATTRQGLADLMGIKLEDLYFAPCLEKLP